MKKGWENFSAVVGIKLLSYNLEVIWNFALKYCKKIGQ